jgi:hypothetical protein
MSYTLKIDTVSGQLSEERTFGDKMELLSNYNRFLHNLQLERFDEKTNDIFVFRSPESNMVAYKDIFGNMAFITTDLFYRRHYVNKELVQKVKSITGEE